MALYSLNPFKRVWQYTHRTPKELVQAGTPYKVYRALVFQAGTDAPVVEVLENSLNINITFSHEATGDYLGIIDKNIFESPNEDVTITSAFFDSGTTTACVAMTAPVFFNAFFIASYEDGVLTDDILGSSCNIVLEIRKYK